MRLTSREKEIFEALKKEPLISQEELAQRFGISRSSAAVHISNLMKKGVILGKGYVFNEQATIVVMGDLYLRIEVDEAQQKIDICQSGSAFDLAVVFARFGVHPKVMTVLGSDDLGTELLMRMQKMDIDTNNILRLPNVRTRRCIYNSQGLIYEEGFQNPEIQRAFEAREWISFNCEYLVVDSRYQEMIYQRVINREEEKSPLLCTYGCPDKVQDIPVFMQRYSIVTLGVDLSMMDACIAKCLELIGEDQQLFVLTDGNNRLVYINNDGINDFPLLPGQVFDYHSRLPRLLAGLVYGLANHYPIRQAVRIGVGAASLNE